MLPTELQINEELWGLYAWWTTIFVLKMLNLTWITGRLRVKYKVFHSDEDRMWVNGPVTMCPSGGGHPAVDQIRECHRRDLRILLLYIVFVPVWLINSPVNSVKKVVIRLIPLSNILFTFIYLNSAKIKFKYSEILRYIEDGILSISLLLLLINLYEM